MFPDRASSVSPWVWPSLVLLAACGCKDPTQVRLHIATDVPFEKDRKIAIVATSNRPQDSSEVDVLVDRSWTEDGNIGTLVLVPKADPSPLNVKVILGVSRDPATCSTKDPDGCIIARRKLSFVKSLKIELPVGLHARCEGVACDEDSTCNALGDCVPAEIDPQRCENLGDPGCMPEGDRLPIGAGGGATDGGATDGSVDVTPLDCDAGGILVESSQATPTGGFGQSIGMGDGAVYLGLSEQVKGLQVFDLSSPHAPMPQGFFSTQTGPGALNAWGNDVLGVHVTGPYAFLATYRGGVVLVDISNPSNPTFMGGVSLDNETWSVWAEPNLSYALAANYQSGLVLIDTTNKSEPTLVGATALSNRAHRFHVDANQNLVFAVGGNFLSVLSWVPSSGVVPTVVDELAGFNDAYDVWFNGSNHVYVVDINENELVTVTYDGPTLTRVDSQKLPTAQARCIDGGEGYLFVGTGTGFVDGMPTGDIPFGSLEVLSTASASSPNHIASVPMAGEVYKVVYDGNEHVYAASGESGKLEVVRVCPPSTR